MTKTELDNILTKAEEVVKTWPMWMQSLKFREKQPTNNTDSIGDDEREYELDHHPCSIAAFQTKLIQDAKELKRRDTRMVPSSPQPADDYFNRWIVDILSNHIASACREYDK